MRRRPIQPRTPAFEAINVTPLIDVVMCLIIFFLIVGKLAADADAVRLPGAGLGSPESPGRALVVSVAPPLATPPNGAGPEAATGARGAGARWFVDGVPVAGVAELEALLAEAAAASPPRTVQIRADRALPFAAVEPVLAAASRAGVISVKLAASRREGPANAESPR